jgi:hypothetical protein
MYFLLEGERDLLKVVRDETMFFIIFEPYFLVVDGDGCYL